MASRIPWVHGTGKTADMSNVPEADLIKEQIAYYRARAKEYDEWFLRQGRYDRGPEHTKRWFEEVETVVNALSSHGALGDVLEFAGGTGIWTRRLIQAASSVTVVDASPEMIELNRSQLRDSEATYIQANIFDYVPDRQFDFLFFGFWLSHVPTERFRAFWDLVHRCLKPGGNFFFVDSLRDPHSTAIDHELPVDMSGEILTRKLNDGREFRIYKLFYSPKELQASLETMGFQSTIRTTDSFFIYGCGHA